MVIPIIDSHVHLWPESAANPDGHAWMSDVPSLAKPHGLNDYLTAGEQDVESSTRIDGIVFVETDRLYAEDTTRPLAEWAKGPLDEVKFIRSIVEDEGEGQQAHLLKGLIPWAPVRQGLRVFEQWLALVERTAGPATWAKVKGFRFLLQAITDKVEFENLVFSQDFLDIMIAHSRPGHDLVFDVCVDVQRGGMWQLQVWLKVLDELNRNGQIGPKFVMNHLCKPDLTQSKNTNVIETSDFKSWSECMRQLARFPRVYMKLSGAFSNLSDGVVDTVSADELARRLRPWTDIVFDAFGPRRVMFGSDWPVCNIRGPAGERSWSVWKGTVETLLAQRRLSDPELASVWSGTAKEAYNLD